MDTSYLSQQVTTIIERLHAFFDEIGVASHERDSRESEVQSTICVHIANLKLTGITALLGTLRNPPQPTQPGRKRET